MPLPPEPPPDRFQRFSALTANHIAFAAIAAEAAGQEHGARLIGSAIDEVRDALSAGADKLMDASLTAAAK